MPDGVQGADEMQTHWRLVFRAGPVVLADGYGSAYHKKQLCRGASGGYGAVVQYGIRYTTVCKGDRGVEPVKRNGISWTESQAGTIQAEQDKKEAV